MKIAVVEDGKLLRLSVLPHEVRLVIADKPVSGLLRVATLRPSAVNHGILSDSSIDYEPCFTLDECEAALVRAAREVLRCRPLSLSPRASDAFEALAEAIKVYEKAAMPEEEGG